MTTNNGATAARSNTTSHNAVEVHRFTDEYGNELVSVALGKHGQHGRAILDAADWDRLIAEDFPVRWKWNDSGDGNCYVRASCGQRNPTVASIITGATSKQVVRYVDGDHRNLRRSNLRLQERRQFQTERKRAAAIAAAGGAL